MSKATTSKKVTSTPCGCGCKTPTPRTYRPGHDARHAGAVGRATAGLQGKERTASLAVLPTPALRAKADGIAKAQEQRDAKKAARAAAQAAAKAAYAEAMGA